MPKNIGKIVATLLLVFTIFQSAMAQNEPQFTQFMFNRLTYNPAYAGSSGSMCGTLLYRNQWFGLKLDPTIVGGETGSAPTAYLFSFDSPIKALHGGIGINAMKESIGFRDNIMLAIDYAFRMYWGPGNLAAAIEANMFNHTFDSKSLIGSGQLTGDPTNPTTGGSDPLLNGSDTSDFMFDLSTGLYYQVPGKYYLGLTVKNLLGTKSQIINYKNARTLYLMGGYEYVLPFNPSFKFKPAGLLKTADFSNFQLDLAAILDYRNTFWGGLTYRVQDALALCGGVRWKLLQVGLSYDFTTSRMGGYKPGRSLGSVELYIRMCGKIIIPQKDPTVYRNTRYIL